MNKCALPAEARGGMRVEAKEGGCISGTVYQWTISNDLQNGYSKRRIGQKFYELTDHLGDVRAIVSDRKRSTNTDSTLAYMNYYAFGMEMPNKQYSAGSYRYGFNGLEKDNEIEGSENEYTTRHRQYDPRLGRWFSIEPEIKKFPELSPYIGMSDSPIQYSDENGDIIRYRGNLFFRAKAMIHVALLSAYSPTAALMIHKMAESPNIVTIYKAPRGKGSATYVLNDDAGHMQGVGSDVYIYLNLKDGPIEEAQKTDPGVNKFSMTADEFSTAARAVEGKLLDGSFKGVSNDDIEAVKEANAVRIEVQPIINAENKAQIRTTYGTDIFGSPNEIFKDEFGNTQYEPGKNGVPFDPQKDAERRAASSKQNFDIHMQEDKQNGGHKVDNPNENDVRGGPYN